MVDLLLATSNPGKLREFAEILSVLPGVRLIDKRTAGLDDFEVDEPFETFTENAVHKARAYAEKSGLLSLSDDSGLAIDALDGRPGVYSARYAAGTDADRMAKVLSELAGAPRDRRTARFLCVAAAARPGETPITAEGAVEGIIADAPGENLYGFGYDPIFIPEGYDVVFSTIPPEAKNRLSHRGRAVAAILPKLRGLLDT